VQIDAGAATTGGARYRPGDRRNPAVARSA